MSLLRVLGTRYSGSYSLATTDGNAIQVDCTNPASGMLGFAFVSVKDFGAVGDGVTDDTAAIQNGISSLAGTGVALWFPAGTYLVTAPLIPPNAKSTFLRGYNATIHSTMAPVGAQTACILVAKPTQLGSAGTIHAAPAIGDTAVQVDTAAKPTVGNWIQLGYPGAGAISGQIFKVLAVAGGAAPFTVTLDRAIEMPFTSGGTSTVLEFTAIPQDIHVEGLTFTGTGDRWVEILGGWRCSLTDCHGTATAANTGPSDSAFSFDVGSRECQYLRCDVDMLGATGAGPFFGIMLESNEGSDAIDCHAKNCGGGGASFLLDGVDTWWTDCEDEGGSGFGFFLGQGGGLGAIDCGGSGLLASSATGVRFGITTNCVVEDALSSSTVGFVVTATTATGTRGRGWTYVGNANSVEGITVGADLQLSGFEARGISVAINVVNITAGAGAVTLRDYKIASSAAANGINGEAAFTGRLTCEDGTIATVGGYGMLIQGAGAVLYTQNARVTAGAVGVAVSAGATFRQGSGCAFDGATTPVSVAGGGYYNRGTFNSANGAQAVAFPDINSTDRVLVTPTAAAATGYLSAQTAGTGFTWTDTGVHAYDYAIL